MQSKFLKIVKFIQIFNWFKIELLVRRPHAPSRGAAPAADDLVALQADDLEGAEPSASIASRISSRQGSYTGSWNDSTFSAPITPSEDRDHRM